jgi:hypothetical protein
MYYQDFSEIKIKKATDPKKQYIKEGETVVLPAIDAKLLVKEGKAEMVKEKAERKLYGNPQ